MHIVAETMHIVAETMHLVADDCEEHSECTIEVLQTWSSHTVTVYEVYITSN